MKTIYNTDGERLSKNLITVSLFFRNSPLPPSKKDSFSKKHHQNNHKLQSKPIGNIETKENNS